MNDYKKNESKPVVIIGNGIAGISAARHIRKLDSTAKITVISSETDYFFSRTALMYVYMKQLTFENTKPYPDDFWAKNRIELIRGHVSGISTETSLESPDLVLNPESSTIIIATGSKPNRLGVLGEDARGVQGFYSYHDLVQMETNTQGIERAVVVGGGLVGIELVEMLLSRKIKVTFLVRENSFWSGVLPAEESAMLNRHIREHGVELRLESEVQEIMADGDGRVKSLITKNGEEIACQFVGIAVGVLPNIDFLKNTAIETQRGVLVDEFLQTNIPNVYAVGDCVQHRNPPAGRPPVEQIWYSGRAMGETVAQTICRKPSRYMPDVFFNSAKFFDIEYQTYGQVPAQTPEGLSDFYWEHPSGKKAVRIRYEQDSRSVIGVNTFGIRMRQEVWQAWIRAKKTIDDVMQHLPEANFDPEFSRKYEKEIRAAFLK